MNIDISYETAEYQWLKNWAWFAHHTLGAILCIPRAIDLSEYGITPQLALILSRHAVTLNMGSEINDIIQRLHERFFTDYGA